MRVLLTCLIALLAGVAVGDGEKCSKRGGCELRRAPWLGLHVGMLDEAMRAHAEVVPRGVGFLVTAVDSEGPAAAAGLRAFDVLWRLDEQLLVNEAQFATLLALHAVGDEVTLGVVRGGEPLELQAVLASARERAAEPSVSPLELPLMPAGVPGMPRTIVYPGSREGEVSRADGSVARLSLRRGRDHVTITDAEGEVVYEGPVRRDGEWQPPAEWRASLEILDKTMEQAAQRRFGPRPPRPRVVVPDATAGP